MHAKQTNHTTTKNIVLIVYFVTVLCHIVNMSNMLNTEEHSNTIKVFLSINKETKTHSCVYQTIYAVTIISPKMLKNKNLPFNIE